MITKEERIKMKKAKQFAALMTDIAEVMQKYNITDMVAIYGFNGEIRNTYLPLGESEIPLYCHISDAFNEWLKQGIAKEVVRSVSAKNNSRKSSMTVPSAAQR